MIDADFFRGEDAGAVLERAAEAAGVPLAVHRLDEAEPEGVEEALVWGRSQCAACAAVAKLPGGRAACQYSRTDSSRRALRRSRSVPFICHMGFSCVSVRTLEGAPYVLTFGPYCPAEAPEALEVDARRGMQALLAQSRRPGSVKTPPLDDVRLAPAAAVPAVAEWTVDELRRLAQSRQTPPESAPVSEAETPPPLAPAKRKTAAKGVEGGAGPAIVAALAAGRAPALRQRIEGPLREVEAQAARRVQAARARAVQLAGEVLAAAQRAGWSTDDAWSRLASVVVDLRAAESVEDLCAALFAFVQRIEPPDRGDQKEDEAFRRLIDSEPGAAPTLEQLADALDMRPEALRGRIARKYGMSFSRFRGTLQVEEAKRLLRDTSLSLAQTARRVGINDGANLRKLFWKFEGMPPSEYRRRFGRK